MTRAAHPCSVSGCPNLQPCADHPRKAWSGSTRRATLPSDWARRRRRTLAAEPTCTCPGCPKCTAPHLECSRPSTEADHTGDRLDHDQLAGRCTICHRHRTGRQAAAGRRGGG